MIVVCAMGWEVVEDLIREEADGSSNRGWYRRSSRLGTWTTEHAGCD